MQFSSTMKEFQNRNLRLWAFSWEYVLKLWCDVIHALVSLSLLWLFLWVGKSWRCWCVFLPEVKDRHMSLGTALLEENWNLELGVIALPGSYGSPMVSLAAFPREVTPPAASLQSCCFSSCRNSHLQLKFQQKMPDKASWTLLSPIILPSRQHPQSILINFPFKAYRLWGIIGKETMNLLFWHLIQW